MRLINSRFADSEKLLCDRRAVVDFVLCFKNGNRVWLHQLAVDKSHRNKGVAKALMYTLKEATTNCVIEFSVKGR